MSGACSSDEFQYEFARGAACFYWRCGRARSVPRRARGCSPTAQLVAVSVRAQGGLSHPNRRTPLELNTRTSIDLRPSADGIEAIELLAGEAMIAKQSDPARAFAVLAGDGQTTATRASFNIRKDGDTVCVTCIQGDVRVQHPQGIATLRGAPAGGV